MKKEVTKHLENRLLLFYKETLECNKADCRDKLTWKEKQISKTDIWKTG